jgi:hypothetical protein
MPGAVLNIEVDDTETIGVGFYPCQLLPCHCNRLGSTIWGQMAQNVAPDWKSRITITAFSLVTCLGN